MLPPTAHGTQPALSDKCDVESVLMPPSRRDHGQRRMIGVPHEECIEMTNDPNASPRGGDQPGQRDEREKGRGGQGDKGGDEPGKVSPQEKDDGEQDGATASAQRQPDRRPRPATTSEARRGPGVAAEDATVSVEGRGGSGASDPTTNRLDNIETADDRTENLNPERDFGGFQPNGD